MAPPSKNSKYFREKPFARGGGGEDKNGWVEIDRVRYDHDVVVHADRSVTKRQKKAAKKLKKIYGHTPLIGAELESIADENPAIVYIGTGQYGDLPVTREAREILAKFGAVIRPTPDVLDLMAEETRPFVAILHVNC